MALHILTRYCSKGDSHPGWYTQKHRYLQVLATSVTCLHRLSFEICYSDNAVVNIPNLLYGSFHTMMFKEHFLFRCQLKHHLDTERHGLMAPLPYIFLIPNKLGCCEKSKSNSLLIVFDTYSIENITVTIYLMFYRINFMHLLNSACLYWIYISSTFERSKDGDNKSCGMLQKQLIGTFHRGQ